MANTLELGNGKWATGKDTVLAFNDENNNFKPLPFSFSRASSGTVVNKAGLIETVGSGEPRIDFKDNTKGALLLEPSRTNKALYSEAFDNSYWIKNDATVVSGFSAPDKTNNAFKLVEGTANGNHYVRSGFITTTDGGSIIPSIFVKSAERSQVVFKEDAYTGQFMTVDLIAETISTNGQNANLTKLANGWFRIDFKSIGKPSTRWKISPSVNSSSTYQGDGTSGLYIWGFQLEDNVSYATSYIPTSGSAVTRVAEVCNNGANDVVINSTEGTLYVEVNLIDGYDNNNFLATIFDNSNGGNNHVLIQRYLGNIQSKIKVGTTQAEITESNTTSGNKKIAFTYKANEFKMFVNGSQVGLTDTIGSVFSPNTLDKINVGSYYNSTLNFNNGVKDVRVYNTALTSAELQALTTI